MPSSSARAPRFALPLFARYRRGPRAAWQDAPIVNMSRSGVLFSTTASIAPGATVELHIVLSTDARHGAVVIIRCRCHIVRIESPTEARPDIRVAATILSYHFHRIAPSRQVS